MHILYAYKYLFMNKRAWFSAWTSGLQARDERWIQGEFMAWKLDSLYDGPQIPWSAGQKFHGRLAWMILPSMRNYLHSPWENYHHWIFIGYQYESLSITMESYHGKLPFNHYFTMKSPLSNHLNSQGIASTKLQAWGPGQLSRRLEGLLPAPEAGGVLHVIHRTIENKSYIDHTRWCPIVS